MPLGKEVGLGPGDSVLDGHSAPPLRRGRQLWGREYISASRIGSRIPRVRLCGFRHICTSGFRVRASPASFIPF